jgi:LysM repeat protein
MEHIVRPGETLSGIADSYGVPLAVIVRANNLQTDVIYAGQRIYIPVPPQQYPQHYSQHYHTHTHTHTHIHTHYHQ